MFVCLFGWLVRSLVCLLVCSFVSSHPAGGRRAMLRAPGGCYTIRALFSIVIIVILIMFVRHVRFLCSPKMTGEVKCQYAMK